MKLSAKHCLLVTSLWALPLYAADLPEPPPFWKYEPPAETPTAPPSSRDVKRETFEPEMVSIPAGRFTMGCDPKRDDVEGGCYSDEKPAHEVSISAFQMAKTEVTFDQWDACEKATACPHAEDQGWGRGNRPVINVSWDDITQKYIPWLNKETGKHYRLPTEAEWEYAARGGTDTAYPWGNKASHEFANYGKDKCCEGLASGKDEWVYTSIGGFAANPYGLHDMHGNVWEWVSDRWGGYAAEPQQDSPGANKGTDRVLRGGSWLNIAQDVRSASRDYSTPDHRFNYVGFRVAQGQ